MLYVVIEDESDRSFSVREDGELTCDHETLNFGDEVIYPYGAKDLKGIVRFVSENEQACVKEEHSLNKAQRLEEKQKANTSFHEDRPRKAAQKYLDNLSGGDGKTSFKEKIADKKPKKGTKPDQDLTDKRNAVLFNRIRSDAEDKVDPKKPQSDTPDSSEAVASPARVGNGIEVTSVEVTKTIESNSSIESSPPEDEQDEVAIKKRKIAVKIAESLHLKDLTQLSNVVDSGELTHLAEKFGNSSKAQSVEKSGQQSTSSMTLKLVKRRKVQEFEGEMLRCSAETENAVKLHEDSDIFCLKTNLKFAKDSGSLGKAIPFLMTGVFTSEALKECTLSGLPPRGKGRESYGENEALVRPALRRGAIDAIIDLQHSEKWRPRNERTTIKPLISAYLSSARNRGL